ncbi:MAG: hypothetical protein HZB39_10995 [Planctomycetes bacterium]|nr:hypothetical protein [Planctomycetota bacterium]
MRFARSHVLALVVALTRTISAQDEDAVWRVRIDADAARIAFGGDATTTAELDGEASARDDELRFSAHGGKATFANDARFAFEANEPRTLTLELRTERGAFATPLMCRAGGVVHYSLVVGRHAGTVSFEPWCWQRVRAESRTRIDDGRWHRIEAVFEALPPRVALLVDGRLESEMDLPSRFSGSPPPALRLGDNLDPNVHQAFVGDLRGIAMTRGLPPALALERERIARTRVLSPVEVDRMLEAWNDRQRERRAPEAADSVAWTANAQEVRALVQDALGLWPPPYSGTTLAGERSPLSGLAGARATDFAHSSPSLPLDLREGDTLEADGCRVTRVAWAAFAGWYATGWLYRPTTQSSTAKRSAVLSPHGHWSGGATHPVPQSRAIVLAREGHVVLAVDSVHVDDDRIALTPLSAMIWSDLRGLEVLRAQPDVDPARIGCTGASGGGQQTYYLAALDSGLAAAVPAVMACHLHEILGTDGPHCHCNHVPHLVRATDMPIMGAAFAPRPQLYLTVTGDWTREFPRRGVPEIAAIYERFGVRDAVSVLQWPKGHDYDREMRNPMYAFFARHLQGVAEPRTDIEADDVATIDPRRMAEASRIDAPKDQAAIGAEFVARLGRPAPTVQSLAADGALETIRDRLRALLEIPARGGIPRTSVVQFAGDGAGGDFEKWLVPVDADVAIPVLIGRARRSSGERCVIVTHQGGMAIAAIDDHDVIERLRDAGVTVLLADIRYCGELDRGEWWRELHGRFYGLDEGQLAVRDLRVLCGVAIAQGFGRPALLAHGWTGAAALLASALDERIEVVVATGLGATWAAGARRPRLARILLHGDLTDAALASHARRLLLGGSPASDEWGVVESRRGASLVRSAEPLPDADVERALRER